MRRPTRSRACALGGRVGRYGASSTADSELTVHWLLFYDYVPDYLERRGALRTAHLEHVKPYLDRGELILGGAFANPADGAVLLFRSDGPEVAERFAEADPYVRQGLVTEWQVREWTTVVGPDAAQPLSPPDER